MAACLSAIAETADREAFRIVFDFYGPRVKGFLMRSGGNAARAEELTQETMAMVWRKAGLFDPQKASASTWIFTIARNLRIDAFRRERHPEIDPDDPVLQMSTPPEPHDKLAGEQDAAHLVKAMAELSDAEQRLLAMAYYEDKSQSKIAAELGLPLGTVKSRMRLIFIKLRARLQTVVRDTP
ncbi:MAG: sigma-70 family RNA polymerase sigma factor [Alphaproteobacteria bacterium]|nr:sigma-70 family RNA polymerase sigma factor [Alphaproteobacteria bacterium]